MWPSALRPVKRGESCYTDGNGHGQSGGPRDGLSDDARTDDARNGLSGETDRIDWRGDTDRNYRSGDTGRNDRSGDTERNGQKQLVSLIMKEIQTSCNTTWDEIAGLESVKKVIKENAVWPLLRPDIFTGIRKLPKVMLLFGPSGLDKRLLAESIATQTSSTFFCLPGTKLNTKWKGKGENLIKSLFKVARNHQLSVIFVEDVENLVSTKPTDDQENIKIKSEFISELEKVSDEEQVLVVAATAKPYEISETARKLFGKKIFIYLPDQQTRVKIISKLISKEQLEINEQEIELISFLTEGYSELDLVNVCKNAALGPVRSINNFDLTNIGLEMLRPIRYQDFQDALDQVKASVEKQEVDLFRDWDRQFGGI